MYLEFTTECYSALVTLILCQQKRHTLFPDLQNTSLVLDVYGLAVDKKKIPDWKFFLPLPIETSFL